MGTQETAGLSRLQEAQRCDNLSFTDGGKAILKEMIPRTTGKGDQGSEAVWRRRAWELEAIEDERAEGRKE
ncbi:hypothetical protein E2C01_068542 [Portunus trituberculatus]|uniref:Uncharacterized protein n=1 Tax=Portunus trituberculatus TaxID=210409 RepID=A0A5B7HS95_PORTR|nr:hypothetical protein [Portunus trituberculatus]